MTQSSFDRAQSATTFDPEAAFDAQIDAGLASQKGSAPLSIIESAMQEMERAGFPVTERGAMNAILRLFFMTWNSGGAVSVMVPVLMRLIAGQPLTPLTGDPDEWYEPVPGNLMQNRRCGSVLKECRRGGVNGDIPFYRNFDVDNPAWDGTFPYYPVTKMPAAPVIAVDLSGSGEPGDLRPGHITWKD